MHYFVTGVTYIASNAKARHDLGYAPRSLEEGSPDALRWEAEQLDIRLKS